MAQSIFIDTHLHLFNIGDIPLYESIVGNMPSGLILMLGGLSGIIKSELKKHRLLIEYFGRERSANINKLEEEMGLALRHKRMTGNN